MNINAGARCVCDANLKHTHHVPTMATAPSQAWRIQKLRKCSGCDLLQYCYKGDRQGAERIRRAAKRIKEETGADIDYGFRVYRLDKSNMQDVYYKPQDYDQGQIDAFADNVKPDRTADDLLAQVMLDWGLPLSLKIKQVKIKTWFPNTDVCVNAR